MSAAYVLTRPPQHEEADAANYKQIAKLMSLDGLIHDLDPNNKRTGNSWLNSWDTQKDAGFIITHPLIVAGDFDSEDGLEIAYRLQREVRFPSFVQHSGGGKGRAHIFFLVWNEAQRWHCANEIIKAAGGRVDAYRDPDKHFGIRPPGALHRLGQSRSTSANGWTSHQLLEWIRDGKRPRKPAKQKADLHQLASEPVPIGFRSTRLCMIAGEAVRQGWNKEAFDTLILSNPEGAGEKIANRRDQAKYLDGVWAEASKHWKPATGKGSQWLKALARDPRVLASRRHLLPAAHAIAELHRTTRGMFHLSIRDLSGKLNSGEKRAWNCINELKTLGWITEAVKGRGFYASTYSLTFPQKETLADEVSEREERGCTERVFPFAELMAHDSLTGRNAMGSTLLCLSPTEPRTVDEVRKLILRGKSSVYKQLKRLVDLKLAVKTGKGYVRIEDKAAHDEAAKCRATVGRGQRRRRTHADQREARNTIIRAIAKQRITAARRAATQKRMQSQLKPASDQATQNGTETEHLHKPQNRTKTEHLQARNGSKTKVDSTSLKE